MRTQPGEQRHARHEEALTTPGMEKRAHTRLAQSCLHSCPPTHATPHTRLLCLQRVVQALAPVPPHGSV